ncbi:MAG TPA: histone deacetylase [Thermoanaerobaculia bacterium]|nr:histone deacetylase [Thermoanaerobaculia bacterium]
MPALAALRRLLRRRHVRRRPVDVVYSARYRLDLPGLALDPRRGEKVLAFLAAEGLVRRGSVLSAPPMPLLALCRVHDADYLESLSDPETLTRIVGFRPNDRERQRIVEVERRMCGGTRLAVERALATGGVALHLGGGFHHAFPARGERFCLFHDVAAAIAAERRRGFAGRVLIVDLDLHDGDGTRAMFAGDETVHTFSLHNQDAGTDPDAVESTSVALGAGIDDAAFLAALERHLPPVVARFRPELAVYVAGVDGAADDFLGDWRLTAEGLLARDRRVTELLRGAGRHGGGAVPMVVVVAGGYGKAAWAYTARYAGWLLAGEVIEPPAPEEVTLARYRRIARSFAPEELTGEPPGEAGAAAGWGLTEDDVLGPLAGVARHRFLGYYTPEGVELALERTGLFDRLRRLGFAQPTLGLDLDNPGGETARVWGGPDRRELLIELRARRDRAAVPGCETLTVEWLLLQNPRAEFTGHRRPLPGQRHPGLGLLEEVISILVLICDRLHLDGVWFVPSHYHLMAQSRRFLRFLDPAAEGRFRAVERAVAGLSLGDATRAVEAGRVVDAASGEPFRLLPGAMVLPVSEGLRRKVEGDDYERRAAAEARRYALRLADGGAGS